MRYEKPQIRFSAIQSNTAVADICWAFGTGQKGKPFYCDVTGPGYCELVINETTGGCDGSIVEIVQYHGGATSASDAEVQAAIAMGGNSGEPFKGSPFSRKVDPSWS